MGEKWNDDLDATRVTSIDTLAQELDHRTRRDQAYLIVLAGNEVGKMFKLGEGETVLGRSHRADIRLDDDSISRLHAKLSLRGSTIRIEDLNSSNGTLINGNRIDNNLLKDGDKIRLGDTTILKFTFNDRLDESFQRKMYDAALRDPLTKAYNKKYFLDQLTTEVAYAARHRSPLSLLIFDADHFKQINDTYGHVAGDYVLIEMSKLVHGMLRAEDVFARYGGEEFVVILRGISLNDAGLIGERIRGAVESFVFMTDTVRMPVRVSVGVASHDGASTDPMVLIEAADEALYAAKRAGRNRVLLKHADAQVGS